VEVNQDKKWAQLCRIIAAKMFVDLNNLNIGYTYSNSKKDAWPTVLDSETELKQVLWFAASQVSVQSKKLASAKTVANPFTIVIHNLSPDDANEEFAPLGKRKGKAPAKKVDTVYC
jgi:hypothetical protein